LYKFTNYFENQVLKKRPYLKKVWCRNKIQIDSDRFRFWGIIPEFENKTIRVITLKDKLTIHNAFPDRSFKI